MERPRTARNSCNADSFARFLHCPAETICVNPSLANRPDAETAPPSPRRRGSGWARGQDMGDTLMTRHGLHFWFLLSAPSMLIEDWTHGSLIVLVEMPDQQVRKLNRMNTEFEFAESNLLTDESFTDKTFAPGPADLTITAYPTDFKPRTIADVRQARRKPTSAFAISFARRGLSQCFVRTDLVVTPQPASTAM